MSDVELALAGAQALPQFEVADGVDTAAHAGRPSSPRETSVAASSSSSSSFRAAGPSPPRSPARPPLSPPPSSPPPSSPPPPALAPWSLPQPASAATASASASAVGWASSAWWRRRSASPAYAPVPTTPTADVVESNAPEDDAPEDSDADEDASLETLVVVARTAAVVIQLASETLCKEARAPSTLWTKAGTAVNDVWRVRQDLNLAVSRIGALQRQRGHEVAPHEWAGLLRLVADTARAADLLRQAVALAQAAHTRSQLGLAPSGHYGDLVTDVAPAAEDDEADDGRARGGSASAADVEAPSPAEAEATLQQLEHRVLAIDALVEDLVAAATEAGLPAPVDERARSAAAAAAAAAAAVGDGASSRTGLLPYQTVAVSVVGMTIGGALAGPVGALVGAKGALLVAAVVVGSAVGGVSAAKLAQPRAQASNTTQPPAPDSAHQD